VVVGVRLTAEAMELSPAGTPVVGASFLDQGAQAYLVGEVLEQVPHPFSIEVVNDGQAALDAIQRHRPDLVLLDVMMPGLSGLDVLETLRDDPAFTSIPVILVTAKSQDEDLLNGYQTGADYFISKPFTPRQLLHGIGLVLGMRLLD
jgi:CheY-like chemotaxis protein